MTALSSFCQERAKEADEAAQAKRTYQQEEECTIKTNPGPPLGGGGGAANGAAAAGDGATDVCGRCQEKAGSLEALHKVLPCLPLLSVLLLLCVVGI